MFYILFIIILVLFFILHKIKVKSIENFYPAWNNHVIYNTLSKRLKIGIWKGWLNINGLQFLNKVIQISNSEVRLFDSTAEVLDALIIKKSIDIASVTEADYGLYIYSKFSKNIKEFSLENVLKNKNEIQSKLPLKRLYSFYPFYRIFLTNNFIISKPHDINHKNIQITNVSNEIYKLDLELLKNFKFTEIYREKDRGVDKYGSLMDLQNKVDGYFTEYDNPNETLKFISEQNNSNLIDLYLDNENITTSKNKDTLFPKSNSLLKKFFFLKKDKMDLSEYPSIVHRREQAFLFYNLNYNPKLLNCYSYKKIFITRDDVNEESIYLLTKKIYENFDFLKENTPYFKTLKKKNMFESNLNCILELHRATYGYKQ